MKWTIVWPGEFPVDCPLQDSVMRVHYKATLPGDEGRIFIDTRSNGGEPVEFASGEGVVRVCFSDVTVILDLGLMCFYFLCTLLWKVLLTRRTPNASAVRIAGHSKTL